MTKLNIKQIKSEILKINLATNSWEDDEKVAQIEVDLLKTKLQNLYELLLDSTEIPSQTDEPEQKEAPLPPHTLDPIEIPEIPNPVCDTIEDNLAEDVPFDGEEVKKLHYIKVLFGGDPQYYQEQMAIIDKLPTFEEVLIHISENYSWSQTDETAELFVGEVAKRFN